MAENPRNLLSAENSLRASKSRAPVAPRIVDRALMAVAAAALLTLPMSAFAKDESHKREEETHKAHADAHLHQAHVDEHADRAHVDEHVHRAHVDEHQDRVHVEQHIERAHADEHRDRVHVEQHIQRAHADQHLDRVRADDRRDAGASRAHGHQQVWADAAGHRPANWTGVRSYWRTDYSGWDHTAVWWGSPGWWRGNSLFVGYSGFRAGYYFAPGYGYYSVPREYWGLRWGVGAVLPPAFWRYHVASYASFGLPPPPYGCGWVWVNGGLALVDLTDGYILDIRYGLW